MNLVAAIPAFVFHITIGSVQKHAVIIIENKKKLLFREGVLKYYEEL